MHSVAVLFSSLVLFLGRRKSVLIYNLWSKHASEGANFSDLNHKKKAGAERDQVNGP